MHGSKKLSKWLLLVLPVLVLGYFAYDEFKLPEFPGSATLSWIAPSENEDDSTLTNLDGYNIRYGTRPGRYSKVIYVNNSELTSYEVKNLPPGIYYFVVTARNSNGSESDLSNVVVKLIE